MRLGSQIWKLRLSTISFGSLWHHELPSVTLPFDIIEQTSPPSPSIWLIGLNKVVMPHSPYSSSKTFQNDYLSNVDGPFHYFFETMRKDPVDTIDWVRHNPSTSIIKHASRRTVSALSTSAEGTFRNGWTYSSIKVRKVCYRHHWLVRHTPSVFID